jgi:hypothetical protein
MYEDQGCQMVYVQNKNPNWVNFRGSFNGDFGILHGHLVYFIVIWNILWPFGMFYDYLVYFYSFWYVVPRKTWQP